MATILQAAGDCGFSVPFAWPSSPAIGTTATTISKLPRHDDVMGGAESGHTTDPEEVFNEYSGEFKGVTRPGEGGVFLPRPGGVSVVTRRSGHDRGCGGGTSEAVSLGESRRPSHTASPALGLGPPSPSPGMLPREIEFQAARLTARTPEKSAIFLHQAGVQKKHHCNDADEQATTRAPSTGPRDPRDQIRETGASRNELRDCYDGNSPAPPPINRGWGESSKKRVPSTLGAGVGAGVSEMDCPPGGYCDGEEPQPRRRPPAYCRVVVVGAGASGLSAAACLRARGEDGVVILERWEAGYFRFRRVRCGRYCLSDIMSCLVCVDFLFQRNIGSVGGVQSAVAVQQHFAVPAGARLVASGRRGRCPQPSVEMSPVAESRSQQALNIQSVAAIATFRAAQGDV